MKSKFVVERDLRVAGQRLHVGLTPAADKMLREHAYRSGLTQVASLIEAVVAFSLDKGGSSEFLPALAWMSNRTRFCSRSSAIEAALWWRDGRLQARPSREP